ncbi:MAG: hypothetical protein Tsb0013_14420 [Phycisphaerales bacterium]
MQHELASRDIEGARVTLMGLGRFGGGVGALRWLVDRGARVTVTDLRTEDQLRGAWGSVDPSRVTRTLGRHEESDFASADVVVVNPAVPKPWDNPFVRIATEGGAVVTTEIRMAIERLPDGVTTLGVTGTTGKSTTASMLHRALERTWTTGRTHLAGNIGGSLFDQLETIAPGDAIVLELSSAQLWWLSRAPAWTPDLALVTNLVANHLDWHGTMEHYESSKRAIVGTRLCCHPGAIERWGRTARVRTAPPMEHPDDMALPGAHNALNAALAREAALWALELGGAEIEAKREGIDHAVRTFEGLDHRLRTIGYARGVRLVNDSKCSTPEGTALAIGAFDASRVHLICGGADKGVDLGPMLDDAARCTSVLCIGATGPTIAQGVRERGGEAVECGDLARAMDVLAARAREGDVALLSPGCASWDQFANYIERASAFRSEAMRVLGAIEDGPNRSR